MQPTPVWAKSRLLWALCASYLLLVLGCLGSSSGDEEYAVTEPVFVQKSSRPKSVEDTAAYAPEPPAPEPFVEAVLVEADVEDEGVEDEGEELPDVEMPPGDASDEALPEEALSEEDGIAQDGSEPDTALMMEHPLPLSVQRPVTGVHRTPVVQAVEDQQERIEEQQQVVDDMHDEMDDLIRMLREEHPELEDIPSPEPMKFVAPSALNMEEQKVYMQAVQEQVQVQEPVLDASE